MRTTIELPDNLFRKLKIVAVQRGITLKALLRTAVEHELAAEHPPERVEMKFPLLDSEEPGALNLTNADVEDLLT